MSKEVEQGGERGRVAATENQEALEERAAVAETAFIYSSCCQCVPGVSKTENKWGKQLALLCWLSGNLTVKTKKQEVPVPG